MEAGRNLKHIMNIFYLGIEKRTVQILAKIWLPLNEAIKANYSNLA